jgi:predicted PurR-regulated permease PerM
MFLSILVGIFFLALPRIYSDARAFTDTLPNSLSQVNAQVDKFVDDNLALQKVVSNLREAWTIDAFIRSGWTMARAGLEKAWHFLSILCMGLLFSFLIMMDLPNLIMKTRALRYSKLAPVYDAMASSVVLFAQVVGENFRAQILISFLNTTLTVLGLTIIGTGSIALLAVVVFCCGLIPVLGVFISSVPIILVAINTGGLEMVSAALALILIIHALEAYVLNPRIVSAAMHINPVVTLMILYVAHSFMGLWGVILGVPISVYFFRQITSNGHKPRNGHPQAVPAGPADVDEEALGLEAGGAEAGPPPDERG